MHFGALVREWCTFLKRNSMVFRHLTSYTIPYLKSSIFTTLGFASVKLRFAEHGVCSRELQESPKRAVSELEESLWELLGLSWGLPGSSWGSPGGRLGSLRRFLGSESAQDSTTRAQYNPRHWISKNLEKPIVFYGFWDLPQLQDSVIEFQERPREG